MANTIKLNFWLNRTKKNRENLVPLMLRISYQGERLDRSSGHYIDEKKWDRAKQRVKGNQLVNSWIEITSAKIFQIFNTIIQRGKTIYLPNILSDVFIEPVKDKTLLEYIKQHNEALRQRLGIDYTQSTYEKYVFTFQKVEAFVRQVLKRTDIPIKELTTRFVMDFDHYLRVKDKNQHNTAVKYCLNLKRIINVAVMQGILTNNPFNAYKTVYKDTPQVYLTEPELQKIAKLRLTKLSHIKVRDLFLFQCYTGLAYTDLSSLTLAEITADELGNKWIIKRRQKSGIICTIPILPQALSILEKHKESKPGKHIIFHTYAIQKYNSYLAEIGDLADLPKRISSHVGRRTFGNIGLSKGVSLNVISKILGHANTLITQRVYAITTQQIIEREIEKWNK